MNDQNPRYGERQIAEAKLEAVPNPSPERPYRIDLTCPEFTCLCPRSGFPDFATIYISYVPDQTIVELKSLKLYINKFRNEYVFHEKAVNQIPERPGRPAGTPMDRSGGRLQRAGQHSHRHYYPPQFGSAYQPPAPSTRLSSVNHATA